jgi:hypothetical protein
MKLVSEGKLIYVYTNENRFAGAYKSLFRLNYNEVLADRIVSEDLKINEKLIGRLPTGAYLLVNENGIIISEFYNDINRFSNGLAAVSICGKWGFIDEAGIEVIFSQYCQVEEFSKNFAAVRKDLFWNCINKKGKELLDYLFSSITFCGDYIIAYGKDTRYCLYKYNHESESCELIESACEDITSNGKIIIADRGKGRGYEEITTL